MASGEADEQGSKGKAGQKGTTEAAEDESVSQSVNQSTSDGVARARTAGEFVWWQRRRERRSKATRRDAMQVIRELQAKRRCWLCVKTGRDGRRCQAGQQRFEAPNTRAVCVPNGGINGRAREVNAPSDL